MNRILCLLLCLSLWTVPSPSAARTVREINTDLLIVGATESGWAAAIQAARMGVRSITIVHDGVWYGGQFTEQALACVDEDKGPGTVGWGVDWHPMKRSFHRSGLFRELMDRIESFNEQKYGSPMPGKPYHGPSTFRPAEAEAVFREMIQPFVDSGQIQVFWKHVPAATHVQQSRLLSVNFTSLSDPAMSLSVKARITIDASDWGDVIQLSGAEYECGPDPKSRYGEPSASETIVPNEMNPITWAMIVEEPADSQATPVPPPPNFDDRNYPRATHLSRAAFGSLKWDRPASIGAITHWPAAGDASHRQLSVYTVRRIVDGFTSKDQRTSILLNYMNGQDYPLVRLPARVTAALEATEPGASQKNIVEMNRDQRAIVFQDARNHSLGVLYHLQNFVHDRADDRTNSFRNFQLSREFGTPDRLPPKPYLRESLRLKAMYMMKEQDGRNRDGETKEAARERFSHVMYPDGLFCWQFHYDFHRTGRTFLADEGDDGPWIDWETPGRHTRHISDRCVFPARSLVPVRMDGLLGAQGNVGYSSIVSAAIRLHDQRIHIGQASGAMAAVSLEQNVRVREIPVRRELLEQVRDGLCNGRAGLPLLLFPWRDLPADDTDFVAINRLSVMNGVPVDVRDVDFRPEQIASEEWAQDLRKRLKQQIPILPVQTISAPQNVTRGELCKFWWKIIAADSLSELTPFPDKTPTDADGDGIADIDDALPFTVNDPIVWKIERPPLTTATDGLIDAESRIGTRQFNFAAANVPLADGFQRDTGLPFSETKGHGWKRDISANARHRHRVPETYRDAFLFTRSEDTWECEVPNGTWQVTVCVGDSDHEQPEQNVTVEGRLLIQNVPTQAGGFHEASTSVTVRDGRLTVTIGRPSGNANTTLCWLALTPVADETPRR
ncbi:MAG: FAD-dependent oxidoreductase [Planctomycetaceae bacterium]